MTKRNIIVLLIDDLGKEFLAAYDSGRTGLETFGNLYAADHPYAWTPNIDKVAGNGITYSMFRCLSLCSPTRAALLTGQYPARNGTGGIVNTQNVSSSYIDSGNQFTPTFTPIARMLRERAGYKTAAFGKWHLYLRNPQDSTLTANEGAEGASGTAHPVNVYGFDQHQGTPQNLRSQSGTTGYTSYQWSDTTTGIVSQETTHVTKKTADAAATWINARVAAGDNYFAWIAWNATHGPFDWPPNTEGGKTRHNFGANPTDGGVSPIHYHTRIRALLEHLDSYIGDLFTAIGYDPANPDATDPVVFILGDNGTDGVWGTNLIDRDTHQPAAEDITQTMYPAGHPGWAGPTGKGWGSWGGTNADPLYQAIAPHDPFNAKATLYEEGVNCPLIVGGNTAEITRSNAIENGFVDCVDLYATWMDLADITTAKPPQLSYSFASTFTGTAGTARDWSWSQNFAPNGLGVGREYYYESFAWKQGASIWKRIWRPIGAGDSAVEEFYDVGASSAVAPTGSITINQLPTSGVSLVQIDDGGTAETFIYYTPAVAATGAVCTVAINADTTVAVIRFNDGTVDVDDFANDISYVVNNGGSAPPTETSTVRLVDYGADADEAATNLAAKITSDGILAVSASAAGNVVTVTTTATGASATMTGAYDGAVGTAYVVTPNRDNADPPSVGSDGSPALSPPNDVAIAATIAGCRDNLVTAINATSLDVTASPSGTNKVDLVHDVPSPEYYILGNAPIRKGTTFLDDFTIVGMSGGQAGDRFEIPDVDDVATVVTPNDLMDQVGVAGAIQDAYNALLVYRSTVLGLDATPFQTPRFDFVATGLVAGQIA